MNIPSSIDPKFLEYLVEYLQGEVDGEVNKDTLRSYVIYAQYFPYIQEIMPVTSIGNYQRTLPRDLFNESKLLKGLGRLSLLIHDGLTPLDLKQEYDNKPFIICQDLDGNLRVLNYLVFNKSRPIDLFSKYNSKHNYTLYAMTNNDREERLVFDEAGKFIL
jgi:hypothetical protein